MKIEFTLPWRTKPKPRPRVTAKNTYMPKEYMQWKKDIADFIALQGPHRQLVRPLSLIVRFGSHDTFVELVEYDTDFVRSKYVKGDIDNLLGGLMDALQDAELIMNDNQVVHTVVAIERRDD